MANDADDSTFRLSVSSLEMGLTDDVATSCDQPIECPTTPEILRQAMEPMDRSMVSPTMVISHSPLFSLDQSPLSLDGDSSGATDPPLVPQFSLSEADPEPETAPATVANSVDSTAPAKPRAKSLAKPRVKSLAKPRVKSLVKSRVKSDSPKRRFKSLPKSKPDVSAPNSPSRADHRTVLRPKSVARPRLQRPKRVNLPKAMDSEPGSGKGLFQKMLDREASKEGHLKQSSSVGPQAGPAGRVRSKSSSIKPPGRSRGLDSPCKADSIAAAKAAARRQAQREEDRQYAGAAAPSQNWMRRVHRPAQ